MGDSDMFSLEMPGALSSKKSTDSLHMIDSLGDIHPLDQYRDSPRESRSGRTTDEIRLSPEDQTDHEPRLRNRRSFDMSFGGTQDDLLVGSESDEPLDDMVPDLGIQSKRVRNSLGEKSALSHTETEYLEDRTYVSEFLRGYHCTSMMPQSSKVVVLDTGISVRSAFHALEENEIESATLWDATEHDYVGIITIGDLLSTLLAAISSSPDASPDVVLKTIENITLKRVLSEKENPDLIPVEPSDTLYEACSIMAKFKVHRVPVIDRVEQNTILFVLTASKIAVFLMKVMEKRPALFEVSLESLQIGRLGSIATVLDTTPLLDALRFVDRKRFAAIPIVNSQGVLVDTLYKSDLARIPPHDLLPHLSKPVDSVLKMLREKGVIKYVYNNTCTVKDSLEVALGRMMDAKHRSLVVIENSKVAGIISLGDILRLFVVNSM